MFKKFGTIAAFCLALVLVGMTGCIGGGNPSKTVTGSTDEFNYSFTGSGMSLTLTEVDWFTTEKSFLGSYQKEREMTFDNNGGLSSLVVKASGGDAEIVANGQTIWKGNPAELKFSLSSNGPIQMNGQKILEATFLIDKQDNGNVYSLAYKYEEQKN
jgi:hypothetical protein